MKEILTSTDWTAMYSDYEYLENHPETAFNLSDTISYVKGRLDEIGVEYASCGKAGICALIGKGHSSTILLRADMDALPLEDGTAMHMCGHHMHTAMLIQAARIIKQNEKDLKCKVKLMFQGAEEILSGAKDMIESGILQNPKVDAAFMLHVATATDFDSGSLIFASAGDIAPSADYFDIEITGYSSHGSEPHKSCDPIISGAHILSALQNINSRELPISEDAVITIGEVHAGSAPNVIPGKLTMRGTLRTYSEETRTFVKKRVEEISKGIAKSLRTSAEVTYTHGCPPFKNDEALINKVVDFSKELLGEEKVIVLPKGQRGGGSEDFSYVSRLVPTAMGVICAGKKQEGYEYPLHNPKVKFDKKALPYGSALMAYIALSYE